MFDFSQFWKEESEIRSGSGYDCFGAEHLTILIAIVLTICLLIAVYRQQETGRRIAWRKIIAVLLPAFEVYRDLVLTLTGNMSIGYLPLHFCSMSIYVFLIQAFSRSGRVQRVMAEISICTLMPAALSALIFPDWTFYPFLNFMSIHSYVWHSMQILYPLMLLTEKGNWPDLRHYWWNVAFCVTVFIPVWCFDKAFRCNYFFVNWPVEGTPLQMLYSTFGASGYIPSLFGLVCAVILAVYIFFFAVGKISGFADVK